MQKRGVMCVTVFVDAHANFAAVLRGRVVCRAGELWRSPIRAASRRKTHLNAERRSGGATPGCKARHALQTGRKRSAPSRQSWVLSAPFVWRVHGVDALALAEGVDHVVRHMRGSSPPILTGRTTHGYCCTPCHIRPGEAGPRFGNRLASAQLTSSSPASMIYTCNNPKNVSNEIIGISWNRRTRDERRCRPGSAADLPSRAG
jgi:hypothetical protein